MSDWHREIPPCFPFVLAGGGHENHGLSNPRLADDASCVKAVVCWETGKWLTYSNTCVVVRQGDHCAPFCTTVLRISPKDKRDRKLNIGYACALHGLRALAGSS